LRSKIRELDRQVASLAVGPFIDDLKEIYRDLPTVQAWLAAVRTDLAEHAKNFLNLQQAESSGPQPKAGLTESVWSRRYGVNVLVDNNVLEGAPTIYEDHPTCENLIGRIEHITHLGTSVTDFSLIKPGALHRANGVYLILEARKVLMMPYAWEALKRSLVRMADRHDDCNGRAFKPALRSRGF
jgi:hypothetical protein